MLYSLSHEEVQRIRAAGMRADFTDAEMLTVAYRTDPDVVARILPRPLEPLPEPLAVAFVARYPETNFGCVYNEGALGVLANYHGRTGFYCVSMPVTDDMAMIYGREIFGFPKKMAEHISLDDTGGKIVGSVVRKGIEILRLELEPTGPANTDDLALLGPLAQHSDVNREVASYLFKFFPRPDQRGFDHAPRLVRQVTVFRPQPGLRKGKAKVILGRSPFDPLADIPVIGEPVAAIHGLYNNTMLPGELLSRVWNPLRFLRHAFFKTDLAPLVLSEPDTETASRDAA